MNDEVRPISTGNYPQAIMHFDGDAFFAAVETAMQPRLQGKPLVTGQERGIIACANYPAKALGIKRGISLHEARRICPELIVLPSDYESYSIYSKRMFEIARRYTPAVEEYSIDEGFADLGGLRRMHRMSYEDIARGIQADVERELGITVSIGLSLSKGLAKLASDFRKPSGFTAVPGRYIHLLLQRSELADVWGFGRNTVQMLSKFGLRNAYDFVCKPEAWARERMGKPGVEIWRELRGDSVHPVVAAEAAPRLSISKTKTFTPASSEREYVYARLLRNLESAFIKLRRHELKTRSLTIGLRKKNYDGIGAEAVLNRPTSATSEAAPVAAALFDRIFEQGSEYRATTVVLGKIDIERGRQYDLFADNIRIEKMEVVARAVDAVNSRFGKHKVHSGTTLYLNQVRENERTKLPRRKTDLLDGETFRQRINIPRLDIDV